MTAFNQLFTQDFNAIKSGLIDARNQYGETALSHIINNCNSYPNNATLIASYLVGLGANVSTTSPYGETPVHQALSRQCDLSMVKLLHNAGGNLTEAAQDSLLYSALSNNSAQYLIENADVACDGGAAATFCDSTLFNKQVFEAYTNKCIHPVITNSGGVWSIARKSMDISHPMVPSLECHYHADPDSEVSFLTITAFSFPADFAQNYAGCAEAAGKIELVHDGQPC